MLGIINPSSQILDRTFQEYEKFSVACESADPEKMPMIDDHGRKNTDRPAL
jgi:hypothetical protein